MRQSHGSDWGKCGFEIAGAVDLLFKLFEEVVGGRRNRLVSAAGEECLNQRHLKDWLASGRIVTVHPKNWSTRIRYV
jgi:hypothetical protein